MAKRRTDNTMAKRRTDNTMAKRRTDNTMAKRRTDNTMAKRRTDNTTTKRQKDRQHNDQKKKDRQHNDQKTEGQTTQRPKEEGQTTQRPKEGQTTQWPKEGQTTQWPKEKGRMDKQWSTKHTHKAKDRGTRSPLITGDGPRCSGWVSSSSSTSGTRRVNLVTNQVIHDERTWKCLRRSVTYPWSFVTQIFHKTFEVMTSTWSIETLGSVASLLAATLYQRNSDRIHKLWNSVWSERYILHVQVFTMGKLKSPLLK